MITKPNIVYQTLPNTT